jgi:hypothetical protein
MASYAQRHAYDEVGDIDVGSIFGKIAHGISSAAKSVGHGISKAAQGVAHVTAGAGRALSHVPIIGGGLQGVYNLTIGAPFAVAAGILSGQRIDKVVWNHLKSEIQSIRQIAPYATTVISFVPGVGTGIAGAIAASLAVAGGMPITQAVLEGVKNALPGGALAKAAFDVGQAAMTGQSLSAIALAAIPISDDQKKLLVAGLNTAKAIAHGDRVDAALLDGALAALPADAKKAIQIGMALGHGQILQATKVASSMNAVQNPLAKGRDALQTIGLGKNVFGQIENALPPAMRRRSLPVLHPELTRAVNYLQRNPVFSSLGPTAISQRLNIPSGVAQRALTSGKFGLMWRPLSNTATQLVRSHSPFSSIRALTDTRGLSPDGLVYVVESGDSPGKIALKLTGKESNWPQLITANPQKPRVKSNIGNVFKTLFAGEKLKVPASWHVPVAVPTPGTAPSPTAPSVVVSDPARANTASVLQAKALMVTWTKTDGKNEAGFPDYGLNAADLSTTYGDRDKFIAASFEGWSNRNRGTNLPLDGLLTDDLLAELRSWAEARVAAPLPTPPAPAGLPPGPILTVPPLPTITASDGSPVGLPTIDLPNMTIAAGAQPKPASSDGGDLALPIAGAIAGWLTAGPVGAAIGGAGGLLLSSKPKTAQA